MDSNPANNAASAAADRSTAAGNYSNNYYQPGYKGDTLREYYEQHPSVQAAAYYQNQELQYHLQYAALQQHAATPGHHGSHPASGMATTTSTQGTSSQRPGKRERKKKDHQGLHHLQSGHQTTAMSRDERKASGARLPINCHDIINLPMDEFNDLLSKHELTEEQLTLCRDIRRRGKNKVKSTSLFIKILPHSSSVSQVAARNCRKRKIDQIRQLEDDVTRIRTQKGDLIKEHDRLVAERSHWTDLVKRLHDHVLKVDLFEVSASKVTLFGFL